MPNFQHLFSICTGAQHLQQGISLGLISQGPVKYTCMTDKDTGAVPDKKVSACPLCSIKQAQNSINLLLGKPKEREALNAQHVSVPHLKKGARFSLDTYTQQESVPATSLSLKGPKALARPKSRPLKISSKPCKGHAPEVRVAVLLRPDSLGVAVVASLAHARERGRRVLRWCRDAPDVRTERLEVRFRNRRRPRALVVDGVVLHHAQLRQHSTAVSQH